MIKGFLLVVGLLSDIFDCEYAQNPWHMRLQEDVLALIDCGGSQGGSEGFHWVLDPIDGTRGFVGMRQYAVCLGLLHKGKVRMCLMRSPPHAESCTSLCCAAPVASKSGKAHSLSSSC